MNKKLISFLLLIGCFAYSVSSCCGMDDDMMVGNRYWKRLAPGKFRPNGNVRTYYIAADEVVWDYAPLQINAITGEPFTPSEADVLVRQTNRIGSQYIKCLYREYKDPYFKDLKQRDPNDEYMGFLGPVIHAEVGDAIKIVYKNNCKFPNNIYTHGVLDDPNVNGTNPAVPPGGSYTYNFQVSDRAAPNSMDGSSIHWKYTSDVDPVSNLYAGLLGEIVITREGWATSEGKPKDVDREIFMVFSIQNENSNPYLVDNINKFVPPPFNITALLADAGFNNANFKDTINGYSYGNGPMATMKRGERVRWYVLSTSGARDSHTPHWHGNTLLFDGMHMDVVAILPGLTTIGDMVPDDVGIWLYHCHVNEHFEAGMITRYQVLEKDKSPYPYY